MNPSTTFPKELLSESVAVRVEYFRSLPIDHRFFKQAFDQAMDAATGQAYPKVVLIAGPTGAGKTTLAKHLCRKIREQERGNMQAEKDFVPVLYGNAIAPNGTSFNWKDFYIRLLEKISEPLIDRKIVVPQQLSIFPELRTAAENERHVANALRRSVEECLRRRRTKVLIIDEAHHILMVANQNRLEFQFEAIKSLAIETGVTIILVGTYRLLNIRDQSGQLVRRSQIIHFPRYDIRQEDEVLSFMSALKAFSDHLPLEHSPNLLEDAEEFYKKTAGGIGILKELLTTALEKFLKTKDATFNKDFILKFALTNKALQTITEEAMAGEKELSDIPISDLEYLLKNGLPSIPVPSIAKPKKSNVKVGKRSPVRDPVGGVYATA